jgi:hypothetical protein
MPIAGRGIEGSPPPALHGNRLDQVRRRGYNCTVCTASPPRIHVVDVLLTCDAVSYILW